MTITGIPKEWWNPQEFACGLHSSQSGLASSDCKLISFISKIEETNLGRMIGSISSSAYTPTMERSLKGESRIPKEKDKGFHWCRSLGFENGNYGS